MQVSMTVIQARSTRGARRTAPAVRTVSSTMSSCVIAGSCPGCEVVDEDNDQPIGVSLTV
jgi:hypothetical protein